MKRPYVNLESENKLNDFYAALKRHIKLFKELEGVEGITLNGGMSRGYADHLSEIDLVIFLNNNSYELWNKGKSPVPAGITRIEKYLYDIKILSLEEESKNEWGSVALWDLSYSKILYDPSGKIETFIQYKLKKRPEPLQAESMLFSCWWYFRLSGDIWIYRNDILQGHYMMNLAVTKLLEALFTANGEYIPHEKWIIHFSRTLAWTPDRWEERILMAMNTGDYSTESLVERQCVIERLWEEIDNYINRNYCPNYKLKIMQKSFYNLLWLLIKNDEISVEEWTKNSSLQILSSEPFFRFVTVAEDKLIINKDKAFSVKPEELYHWHYEVLEKALAEMLHEKWTVEGSNMELPPAFIPQEESKFHNK